MGLAFRKGDEFSTLLDFDISLSGYTVSSVITSMTTGVAVISPLTSVADAAAGQVSVSLTETQTASMAAGTYSWELVWVAPGDVKRTALTGTAEVRA